MGMKFGEINANQILENEFRVGVLERLLEYILKHNLSLKKPNKQDVQEIKEIVMRDLRKKYPNSGIELKG